MKVFTIGAVLAMAALLSAQRGNPPSQNDPIRGLVEQLSIEKYKATIKGLTQFGDRHVGTERNRNAIDWIEAQLKSYGCANTERLKYDYAVYCTKIGTTRPDEMYIVSAHMDGMGFGEAANDDGSGTAIVMELAHILHSPGVQSERSIRFILWNNEETGREGSRAYVSQRRDLQGKEEPPGSGHYPEPKWIAVIQHDMMLFDHGMPRADGTVSNDQRPEADVNVEFQMNSMFVTQSQALAWALEAANVTYATDYPVAVGAHMESTDSVSFQDFTASVSVRENERGSQIGTGWNPHWHQVTDLFATYSDKDFRLGLNAAQTTLAAVAELARVTIKR